VPERVGARQCAPAPIRESGDTGAPGRALAPWYAFGQDRSAARCWRGARTLLLLSRERPAQKAKWNELDGHGQGSGRQCRAKHAARVRLCSLSSMRRRAALRRCSPRHSGLGARQRSSVRRRLRKGRGGEETLWHEKPQAAKRKRGGREVPGGRGCARESWPVAWLRVRVEVKGERKGRRRR
jgi:hypothetical protein